MLHFELGNYLLLKHLVEANQKLLKRQNDYFETEDILFKLFKSKAFQQNQFEKLNTKFKNTHIKLVQLYSEDEFEKSANKILNCEEWLASKS